MRVPFGSYSDALCLREEWRVIKPIPVKPVELRRMGKVVRISEQVVRKERSIPHEKD
jgi:hypothetical protein